MEGESDETVVSSESDASGSDATELAPREDETVVVPGKETQPELAWSVDAPDYTRVWSPNGMPPDESIQRPAWVVYTAIAAAATALVGVAAFWWGQHQRTEVATPSRQSVLPPSAASSSAAASPPPESTAPLVFPASAIDTLLLTPAQIRTTTGGVFHGANSADMVVTTSTYGMSDHTDQVDPPSCVGVIFGADPLVYNGTDFEAIRDQTLDSSSYTTDDEVEQTAVVFPSATNSRAVLTSQTKQWQACANRPNPYPPPVRGLQMGQRHGEGGYTWTLADVQVGDDLITVKMAGYDNEAGSDQVCQQALGVHANVVVKIRACQEISRSYTGNPVFTDASMAGDYGERLANAILNRVAEAMRAGSPAAGLTVDAQGFVGHSARCAPGDLLAALVRTAQSLAVVCQTPSGSFYYHGQRLSDGADITLLNAVRSADGFEVTNPADGTRYEVRPDRLTIISNGHADSERVLQYASG